MKTNQTRPFNSCQPDAFKSFFPVACYTAIMDYEEVARLMEEHGIDKDTAEKAQELIEEQDLDEDEAIELAEEM